jgi:hypothetical protein
MHDGTDVSGHFKKEMDCGARLNVSVVESKTLAVSGEKSLTLRCSKWFATQDSLVRLIFYMLVSNGTCWYGLIRFLMRLGCSEISIASFFPSAKFSFGYFLCDENPHL